MLNLTNSVYTKSIRKPSTNHRFVFNSSNNKFSTNSNYSNIAQYEKYKVPVISYSNIIPVLDKQKNNNTIKMGSIEKYIEEKKDEKEVTKRSGIIFISRKNEEVKLLVVKGNGSGIYSFPKGRQNEDETVETCAIREVMEETGIQISEEELLDKKKCKIGKNTYFIIEVNEDDYQIFNIKDTREVSEVSWKTIDELKNIICNKDISNILQYPTKKFYYHNFIFTVSS
jgi:8-oxo-dGTP pyrophosphatase MutT (NUDIX family)